MPPTELRIEPGRTLSDRKALTVDVHCHLLTLEVERLVSGCPEKEAESAAQLRMYGAESVEYNRTLFASLMPQLTDISERLRRMDAMGVDMQVLSPSPNQYYYWADVDLAKQIVATQNEHMASVCAAHPDRLERDLAQWQALLDTQDGQWDTVQPAGASAARRGGAGQRLRPADRARR